MDTYNIVIDYTMIQNTAQTNLHESMDLFSISLLTNLFLLGVIPSFVVYKIKVEYGSFKTALWTKIKTVIICLVVIFATIFLFSKFYSSFFREHKPLRFYTNPTFAIYSLGKYVNLMASNQNIVVKPIGLDAKSLQPQNKKLHIVVVGETARASSFSLNGYDKETNPLLKQEDIVNLGDVSSCGTSTAISVPCMFSIYTRSNYSYKKGLSTQNVLDVVNHTNNVNILWRDNNSDSKGVALRVTYEDYRNSKKNTMCKDECRDEGMLVGLQDYIDKSGDKDVLIVLHQMGNHGPAYYKRYPKEFEKFTPVCKTNQLEKCTIEEINNAYDNVILYTDYFLSKVINLLKQDDETHETSMIYMSDHGESLGENGLYLHGLPYFMAPSEQTKVGALMWFGEQTKKNIDIEKIRKNAGEEYSHANLFHTILGLMEIETSVYNKNLDILNKHK